MAGITSTWIRKNSVVEAVRANRAEIHKIATWCGGSIMASDSRDDSRGVLYIQLPFKSNYNKPNRVYMGDWIVKDDEGFKVYSHEAFSSVFPKKAEKDEKKYAEILKLVKHAMSEQDVAAYYAGEGKVDTVMVAKQVAQQIYELG
jgi:hypothetical protein